jgi:epoxyqueuosine reductase
MNSEIIHFLKQLFAECTLNYLPQSYGGGKIFSNPLIGVANGNNPIFNKFKEVVGPEHLTPIEMWISNNNINVNDSELRIISIIFPFVERIRRKAQSTIKLSNLLLPAEIYSVGRNYANAFKEKICEEIIKFLEENGFSAVAPMLSEKFTIFVDQKFYSNWSERHIAFAAGLGTFSLHEGLITEAGCNIRLASIITNAPLEITPRKSDNPYANCLYYAKGNCRKCEENCPAKAISKEGHDKFKCYDYGEKIAKKMTKRIGLILKPHLRRVNGKLRPPSFPVGCAFCQFNVPCMDKNPMAHS